MKFTSLPAVLCMLFFAQAQAQYHLIPDGTTIANASGVDTSGLFPFQNPSATACFHRPVLEISVENRFIITELSLKSCSFLLPNKHFNSFIHLLHQGFSLFHQFTSGAGISKSFGNRLGVGVELNYHAIYQPDLAMYHGQWVWQGGLLYSLPSNWLMSFHAFNPFLTRFSSGHELAVPSRYAISAKKRFSDRLEMFLNLEQEAMNGAEQAQPGSMDTGDTSATGTELNAYAYTTRVPETGLIGLQNLSAGLGWECMFSPDLKIGIGLIVSAQIIPQMNIKYRFSGKIFRLKLGMHPILGIISNADLQFNLK